MPIMKYILHPGPRDSLLSSNRPLMKRVLTTLLIILAMLQACNNPSKKIQAGGPDNSLNLILSNYYEGRLKLYPLMATNAGDNRYNDLLPNFISENFRSQLKSFYSGYLDSLSSIDKSTLSDQGKLSYEILEWECNDNLEGLKFPFYLMPIDQFWTLQLDIGRYAGGTSSQPFKTATDYRNWLKRLTAYVTWCDTAIANMRIGIRNGYVLPRSLVVKIIPQLAAFDHGPVESHLFYQPILNMPLEITDKEKQGLSKEYYSMVDQQIIPIYKKLRTFFENEYLPAARETSGFNALPDGDKMYSYLIKEYTTTNLTADEIFEKGQNEVARLMQEMTRVKDSLGFKGSIIEFFDYVREKKDLMPYDSAQQVIEHFKNIYERIKPNLANLFDHTPKTLFEIRRTESFREATASAEYQQGSLDGFRPGIFYVPVPDAKIYNIFSDEDLFLHEAIPGHHYQVSLQQEDTTLPEFRRTLWYNAYGEGWALYCESLGGSLGLYTDPYQYFGMLSNEMHRAIRLVVDVGIHSKGWSREKAIQYSLQHEAETENNIISEIERYMAMPAQALSYKIGQLKILELKEKAEKILGKKFDIREFHCIILESGCLPLELLEKKVDKWIKTKS
jgi:uncharacterized protein (DUF885 family)